MSTVIWLIDRRRSRTSWSDAPAWHARHHDEPPGRRTRGRWAFVGEGGPISFPVSELLIHKQITLHGS
jgi:hypothetical protein